MNQPHAATEFANTMQHLADRDGITTTISAQGRSVTFSPNHQQTGDDDASTPRLVTGGNPSAPANIPSPKLFEDNETDFIPAPELEEIAESLIAHYTEELGHLTTVNVRCVWAKKGVKKCGKAVLGTCTRPGGITRFFAHCDFVVAIAADHATTFNLTAYQLEALVFHELLHADYDTESAKPSVRGHDCEMFFDEIKYYGLWTNDLREARIAFDQQPLPLFGQTSRAA